MTLHMETNTKDMKLHKHLFALALSIAAFTGLQAQTTVHIKDSEADGRIIPKEIYGQFSEHLGSCILYLIFYILS